MPRSIHRLSATSLFCAAALALAACGGGPEFTAGGRELPTPEEPGVYVLTPTDELRRIDGSPEWERKTWPSRSDFSPGVEFIVHEPALASGGGSVGHMVKLWRVAWLRSELEPTGHAAPVSGSQWVVASLDDLRVPLTVTPHPEVPGIVHLGPAERLGPGLYELHVSPPGVQGRQGRIGVLWSSLDKRAYSSAHCVDRVLGGGTAFQPCTAAPLSQMQAFQGQAAQVQASQVQASQVRAGPDANTAPNAWAGQALKIELFDPVRENGGLRIQGTVRNGSNRVQTVPMLQATVLDRSGQPVDSWVFAPPESDIAPGEQLTFTTWRPVAEGASRLDVDFARTDQRAGLQ